MADTTGILRSAWAKWTRGLEHQQVLARASRERARSGGRNRYERCDNATDRDARLIRMHWHLAGTDPVPEL